MQWPPTRPGVNGQEIPLGLGGVEDVPDRHVEFLEDPRHLVHEGDVDVALRILDRLGALGRLDRGGTEGAPGGDALIQRRDAIGGFGAVARHHLDDAIDGMFAVARIDPLGAVSDDKILFPDQPRGALDRRHAQFLGDAGINRALEDDQRLAAAIEHPADHLARAEQRTEIGAVALVDRSRDGDNIDVGGRTRGGVGCVVERACGHADRVDLAGAILASDEFGNPGGIDVESDRGKAPRQRDRQRQIRHSQAPPRRSRAGRGMPRRRGTRCGDRRCGRPCSKAIVLPCKGFVNCAALLQPVAVQSRITAR